MYRLQVIEVESLQRRFKEKLPFYMNADGTPTIALIYLLCNGDNKHLKLRWSVEIINE